MVGYEIEKGGCGLGFCLLIWYGLVIDTFSNNGIFVSQLRSFADSKKDAVCYQYFTPTLPGR